MNHQYPIVSSVELLLGWNLATTLWNGESLRKVSSRWGEVSTEKKRRYIGWFIMKIHNSRARAGKGNIYQEPLGEGKILPIILHGSRLLSLCLFSCSAVTHGRMIQFLEARRHRRGYVSSQPMFNPMKPRPDVTGPAFGFIGYGWTLKRRHLETEFLSPLTSNLGFTYNESP